MSSEYGWSGVLCISYTNGSLQSLDGIVVRDNEGIEKRYPVILTSEEKLIARKVSLAFKVRSAYKTVSCSVYTCTCIYTQV